MQINMNFIFPSTFLRESHMKLLCKSFPSLVYIYTRDRCQEFYMLLMYAGLDSKFKHLRYIDPPYNADIFGMYVACALVFRNTLAFVINWVETTLTVESGKINSTDFFRIGSISSAQPFETSKASTS